MSNKQNDNKKAAQLNYEAEERTRLGAVSTVKANMTGACIRGGVIYVNFVSF